MTCSFAEILFTPFRNIPLLLPSLAWVFALVFTRLQAPPLLDILLLSAVLLLLYKQWRQSFTIVFLLGLLFASVSLDLDKQKMVVDSGWLDQKIEVKAKIERVIKTKQYTRLRLSALHNNDSTLAGFADVYLYRNYQHLMPGMLIQATVKFHQPRNKKNPAYFDYQQYTFEQHIALIGSVSGDVKVLQKKVSWLLKQRQKIRSALHELDDDKQGILLALLLADRSQVPLAIDDAFSASGATHLLAISGLHIGLVAGWGFMLMWWLVTRREAWIVHYPVHAMALAGGLLLVFAYATLAAWPIPAQRASLMLVAGVLAWWLRASQMPINTMLAALIVITCIDSVSVLSVSLWLSFVATTALLVWVGKQQPAQSVYSKLWLWFKSMFWVSVVASLATLPLIGFIFERLPVWSLLTNILLVPLYALWVLPLALLGELCAVFDLPSLAIGLFKLSGLVLTWTNQWLMYIYTLPGGHVWLRGDLPWMYVLISLFFIVSGIFWLKKLRKTAFIVLFSTLFLYVIVMQSEAKIEQPTLYVWDVGQGASTLLSLPDFHLLVDAPGKKHSKYNGGTIATQNMRKLGLLHLDAAVFTHAQSDHIGGLPRLLATLNHTQELWLADVPENHTYPIIQAAMQQVHVLWLKRGDSFVLNGGTQVDVLWPPKGYAPKNSNNASLVLQFTLATGQTLLLAGDMEKSVEKSILSDLIPMDVILMPHHGSKTSSTKAFVDKVRPKIVIAQTGYKNFYGFPKDEVVQRYKDVGSRVFNTAEGAVTIVFEDKGFVIK